MEDFCFIEMVNIMKKLIVVFVVLVGVIGLMGCNKENVSLSETETVSKEYGTVIELAKTEFNYIFKEFENIKIEETATMTRTEDENEVVVQIKYSSSKGSGVYGFLYSMEDYANPELLEHGENVTIDSLLQ